MRAIQVVMNRVAGESAETIPIENNSTEDYYKAFQVYNSQQITDLL
jgi:hypothetical protein